MKVFRLALAALLLSVQALAQSGRFVTVSAVGDIMMGTNFPTDTLPPDGGKNLFRDSRTYIQAADIRFGNLEGPLFDGEKNLDGKAQGKNRYLFRTPPPYVAWLAEAGFNVLSLANNHAMDFGASGLESTKNALRQYGIQYSGKYGGEVARFEVRGLKVALIACDFYAGPRSLRTPENTYQEIQSLRRDSDIVIVSVHAGAEGKEAERVKNEDEIFMGENRGNSIAFAHAAIDSGAALVLMHGPHVPRGLEVYKNKLIAYSLGNFVTGRGINILGFAGLAPLLRVQLDENGNFVGGHLASFRQQREANATVFDASQAALNLIKDLSALDFPQSMPQFDLNSGQISP